MSFQNKSYEESKRDFKPMKSQGFTRKENTGLAGSPARWGAKAANEADSGLKRSPMKRQTAKKGTKKRAKRPKMPTRQSLVRKADALVSLIVRARDGRCVECGSVEKATNGHVLGRRSHGTRFDTTPDGNCHQQCAPCNFRAAHTAAASYHAWYVRTFGAEAFDALYRRWAGGKKWSRPELMELVASLKIQLAGMERL